MIEMKPCPACGAMLTAALADAVRAGTTECPTMLEPPKPRPGAVGGFLTAVR